ncbi:hypothetical protein, partial [Sulfitobacter sp. HI0021]|uniref:hypothetical protein n=1 Tax=Sulfitobacter sp. HI0021 TaxID=1822224 RepID=UPI001F1B2BC1
ENTAGEAERQCGEIGIGLRCHSFVSFSGEATRKRPVFGVAPTYALPPLLKMANIWNDYP